MSWTENTLSPLRNLLDINTLSLPVIEALLERGEIYFKSLNMRQKVPHVLDNRIVATFFLEPSTRTRLSFEIAAKHLGATLIDVSPSQSSLKKGETLNDTIETLRAMNVDYTVIRHSQAGTPQQLASEGFTGIINAGDGMHAHPTQALLDTLTLKRHLGHLKGRTVAICGDIKHSRVARSDIRLLTALGCTIHLIAPPSLLEAGLQGKTLRVFTTMEEGLKDVDALIMLRIQKERMSSPLLAGQEEYFHYYGLTKERYNNLEKGVLLLHPGPVNKYVEIDPDIMYEPNCLIREQIKTGVAIRMAVFSLMKENS